MTRVWTNPEIREYTARVLGVQAYFYVIHTSTLNGLDLT